MLHPDRFYNTQYNSHIEKIQIEVKEILENRRNSESYLDSYKQELNERRRILDGIDNNGMYSDQYKSEIANSLQKCFDFIKETTPVRLFVTKFLPNIKEKYQSKAQTEAGSETLEFSKYFLASAGTEAILEFCAEYNAVSDARTFMGFYSELGEKQPDSRFNYTADSLSCLNRSNEKLPPERIKTYQKPEQVKEFFMRLTVFDGITEEDINNLLGHYFEGFPEAEFLKKIDVGKREAQTRKQRTTQFIWEFKKIEKKYNKNFQSPGENYGYFLSEVFFDTPKTEKQTKNFTNYYIGINKNIRELGISLDF